MSARSALLVAGSMALFGCPAPDVALVAAPEVRFAGCSEVTRGPVCRLAEPSSLTLWWPGKAETRIRLDGQVVTSTAAEVQGGLRVAVPVDPKARVLEVHRSGAPPWRLSLGGMTRSATVAAAERLMQRGALDEAWDKVAPRLDAPTVEARARAVRLGARIRLRQGRVEEAVRAFRTAIALDREAGLVSAEFLDRFALTYALVFLDRDLEAARQVTGPLDGLEDQHPEGRALRPYFDALVTADSGEVAAPLAQLATAIERAEQLGLTQAVADAETMLVRLLRGLGRYDEAAEIVEGWVDTERQLSGSCARVGLRYNRAWLAFALGRARGRPLRRVPDPAAEIRDTLTAFRGPCRTAHQAAVAALGLADVHISRGERSVAAELVQAATIGTSTRSETYLHVLHARAQLEVSAGGATTPAIDALERASAWAVHAEAARWAVGLRARWLARYGRVEDAEAAFDRAQALMDRQLGGLPLGQGRTSFLEAHDALGREHVDFLLKAGRAEAALEASRRSAGRRVRWLALATAVDRLTAAKRVRWSSKRQAYLSARDDYLRWQKAQAAPWTLPAPARARALEAQQARAAGLTAALSDALGALWPAASPDPEALVRPLPPGYLQLVFRRLPEGWVAFARTARSLAVATSTRSSPRAAAEDLLVAHWVHVEAAKRIEVLSGGLSGVDLQTVEVRGRPLLTYAPVVFGLEVGRRPPSALAEPWSAVVVASDPEATLARELSDLDHVTRGLPSPRWRVVRRTGVEVDWRTIRADLDSGLTLFHFSGHGRYAGRDGWQSGLQLSGQSWLTAADVLTLERPPQVVVLVGCDTGASGDRGASLGLAEAFVIAGSGVVVATTRPVDDVDAAAFVRELYRAPWTDAGLGARARSAQLAMPDEGVDIGAFRVLAAAGSGQ